MAESAFAELSRRLAVLVAKLDSTYDELLEANRAQREANQEQRTTNDRLTAAIERLDTLLARMLRQSENGREA
jgi:hypothetical protein